MLFAPPMSGDRPAHREPVKLRGRTNVKEDLRERCFNRLKESRRELVDRLRAAAGDGYECDLRATARAAVRSEAAEMQWETPGGEWSSGYCAPCCRDGFNSEQEPLPEDLLLALEEEIYLELERQALEEAALEAERLQDEQNEADCELYEQHLLGGVPCPLCHLGRLDMKAGLLACTRCTEMRAEVMDESLTAEDAGEFLGLAEERHRGGGCHEHATFEVKEEFGGPRLLFLSCKRCGWNEVVL